MTDLRKERLGTQETFKICLLSVVSATKGDMRTRSSAASALESRNGGTDSSFLEGERG